MNIIFTGENTFEETFRRITRRGMGSEDSLRASVKTIVDDVAARGDAALLDYTEKFDQSVLTAGGMEVSGQEWSRAAAEARCRSVQDGRGIAANCPLTLSAGDSFVAGWRSAFKPMNSLPCIGSPFRMLGLLVLRRMYRVPIGRHRQHIILWRRRR